MIKIIESISDTYITNRFDLKNSNVGNAATLDLFKIRRLKGDDEFIDYSRALLKFDLLKIQEDIENQKIDINHPSFFAKLSLKDAYGGQTTPVNFTINVHPLLKPFDEGIGKDIVGYSDIDSCNFITSSFSNNQFITWSQEGCSSPDEDFNTDLISSQFFPSGEEDLLVDVTDIVKNMIESDNNGFRVSFSEDHISDNKNYFVKRFSARNAYDESKRPTLIIGFDDSLQDTSTSLTLFKDSQFITKNYYSGELKNIVNRLGETLVGEDCLKLKITGIPGREKLFSASQAKIGSNYQTGIYSSSVNISFNDLKELVIPVSSGSIGFFSPLTGEDHNLGFSFFDSDETKVNFIFSNQITESDFTIEDDIKTFTIPFSSTSTVESVCSEITDLINSELNVSPVLVDNKNGTFRIDLTHSLMISENNRFITEIGKFPRGINVTHFNYQNIVEGDYYLSSSWFDSNNQYQIGPSRKIKISTHGIETDFSLKSFEVSSKIQDEIQHGVKTEVIVHFFNKKNPYTSEKTFKNLSTNFQGILSDAHYCIREALTNREVISFDLEKGSTRISSDFEKLFFELDTSNLSKNRSYIVDILLVRGDKKLIFKNTSPIFKITT
jgi:hypothetical protein